MSVNRYSLLALLVVILGCNGERASSVSLAERVPDVTIEHMLENIDELRLMQFKNDLTEDEISRYKRIADVGFDSPETLRAILQLWISGDGQFLKLQWWNKREDTVARTFIIALDWCEYVPPKEKARLWPGAVFNYESNARRFSSPEREVRLGEIRLVREYRLPLRSKIYEILKASNVRIAEDYRD